MWKSCFHYSLCHFNIWIKNKTIGSLGWSEGRFLSCNCRKATHEKLQQKWFPFVSASNVVFDLWNTFQPAYLSHIQVRQDFLHLKFFYLFSGFHLSGEIGPPATQCSLAPGYATFIEMDKTYKVSLSFDRSVSLCLM